MALPRRSTALAAHRPVIIDESDGELSSFPTALTLGYAGVSSKNCKGFYKSILNAARVARLNAEAGAPLFHVGRGSDDLARHQRAAGPGAGVAARPHPCRAQCAIISSTACRFAPEAEQNAFVAAHPDLYEKQPGKPARLKATGGKLALGSLDCPGLRRRRRDGLHVDARRCRPRRRERLTGASGADDATPAGSLRHASRRSRIS